MTLTLSLPRRLPATQAALPAPPLTPVTTPRVARTFALLAVLAPSLAFAAVHDALATPPAHAVAAPVAAPVTAPVAARAALPPAVDAPARASRGGARSTLPPARTPATRAETRLLPAGPAFTGDASWYGPGFAGHATANGEPYDPSSLTAASRTLPFGTLLRVCRESRCVVVRINDRGPYVGDRVLDLSAAAADRLGYSGVSVVTATPVQPTVVRVPLPLPPPPAPAAAPHAPVRRPADTVASDLSAPGAPASGAFAMTRAGTRGPAPVGVAVLAVALAAALASLAGPSWRGLP